MNPGTNLLLNQTINKCMSELVSNRVKEWISEELSEYVKEWSVSMNEWKDGANTWIAVWGWKRTYEWMRVKNEELVRDGWTSIADPDPGPAPTSQARPSGRRAPAHSWTAPAGALASSFFLALPGHLLSQVPTPLPAPRSLLLPPGEARREGAWSGRRRSKEVDAGWDWVPLGNLCLRLSPLCWSVEITDAIQQ